MYIINNKNHPVSTLAICYLLGTSFFPAHLNAAAGVPDPLPALSDASSDVAQPIKKLFDIYDACLADFKEDNKKMNSISLAGYKAKQAGKLDEAILLLREAASYGHFTSMFFLGEIYEHQKNFQSAYTWYVLAFEEHWLSKGTHLPTALKKLSAPEFRTSVLKSLSDQEQAGPSKFFRQVDEISAERFSWFLDKLNDNKSKEIMKLKHYLTKEESELRALRFGAKIYEKPGELDPWGRLAEQYYLEQDFYKVNICSERSGTPNSLYILGVLCDEGKIPGGPTKAAECYRSSGISSALYNLGLKYHKREIEGGQTKAVECYRSSGNPDALFSLGLLYEEGEIPGGAEEAAKCYRQSKTPGALLNLGNLCREGKIPGGATEAAECYRQSKTPNAFLNLGHLCIKGEIPGGAEEAAKWQLIACFCLTTISG